MKTATRFHLVGLPLMLATLLTFLASVPVGASAWTGSAARNAASVHPHVAAPANTAVLTYKNDTSHSGLNPNETILTPNNVNDLQFGRLASYGVDGNVYAQPLYMPNLTINGSAHNVVFVATENDSVYAFDADSHDSAAAPLWKTNFLGPNVIPVTPNDIQCNDVTPNIGITSTPVIDPNTNTMYVVTFSKDSGTLTYHLHALDVTTGLEKGSPIVISAVAAGNGEGSVNGQIHFDAHRERQRSSLLWANGQLYMAFSSDCDITPYHGWILSYTFNGSAFQQAHVYNDTPDGGLGGIWGGAGGLVTDASGNIYTMTGNGTFRLNGGTATDTGDSFVKLSPSLTVLDYFAPFNQACLEATDADLGSGGILLMPSINRLFGAGKEGRIYELDMNHMGGYTSISNPCSQQGLTNVDHVVQELPPHTTGGIFNTPSTWSSSTAQYVYFGGINDHIKQFAFSNGKLSSAPIAQSNETLGFFGGNTVISSNGNTAGIVWVTDPSGGLRAYDATNISRELYNSAIIPGRDGLVGAYVKFSAPTVANGEVFVGTKSALNIYGELPNTAGNNFNNVGVTNDSNTTVGNIDGNFLSYSAQTLNSAGFTPGATKNINGFSFQWPNAQPGTPDNWLVEGQTLPVTSVAGADVLGILGMADYGNSAGTATMNFTDGTSQTFSLGLTDWWGWKTPAFNNAVVATFPYLNTHSGQVRVTVGLLMAQVVIPNGKTVQSLTLPSTLSGGQMHVFALATRNSASLNAMNNVGTSSDAAPGASNLDGVHHSYSAQALASMGITPGGSVNVNDFSFQWPNVQVGAPDNWLVNGQLVPVTSVSGANVLGILGSSDYGSASGTATMYFTDGSSQNVSFGLTDWWGWKTPQFNNTVVVVMPYQNTPSGRLNIPVGLFLAQVPIPAGKVLQRVMLPVNAGHPEMHVFAFATKNSASGNNFNNVGISNDLAPTLSNIDGIGEGYSSQALAAAGITPGNALNTNGYTFQWPNVQVGTPDNWVANGQVISVNSVSGATTLGILGDSDFGNASGTLILHFTDGTSQSVTLGFTDWWGWKTPAFSNTVVATMPYHNQASGKLNIPVGLFLAQIPIPAGKVLQSVTLPTSISGGRHLHVFALATRP